MNGISEDEIRRMVREAIAKHGGRLTPAASPMPPPEASLAAFARFQLVRRDDGGECLIEPALRCHHCGFCQTYGH